MYLAFVWDFYIVHSGIKDSLLLIFYHFIIIMTWLLLIYFRNNLSNIILFSLHLTTNVKVRFHSAFTGTSFIEAVVFDQP